MQEKSSLEVLAAQCAVRNTRQCDGSGNVLQGITWSLTWKVFLCITCLNIFEDQMHLQQQSSIMSVAVFCK